MSYVRRSIRVPSGPYFISTSETGLGIGVKEISCRREWILRLERRRLDPRWEAGGRAGAVGRNEDGPVGMIEERQSCREPGRRARVEGITLGVGIRPYRPHPPVVTHDRGDTVGVRRGRCVVILHRPGRIAPIRPHDLREPGVGRITAVLDPLYQDHVIGRAGLLVLPPGVDRPSVRAERVSGRIARPPGDSSIDLPLPIDLAEIIDLLRPDGKQGSCWVPFEQLGRRRAAVRVHRNAHRPIHLVRRRSPFVAEVQICKGVKHNLFIGHR